MIKDVKQFDLRMRSTVKECRAFSSNVAFESILGKEVNEQKKKER